MKLTSLNTFGGKLSKKLYSFLKQSSRILQSATRSSIYKKDNRFADYMMISNGIKVVDFKVMDNLVSDHLPLYLEFAL